MEIGNVEAGISNLFLIPHNNGDRSSPPPGAPFDALLLAEFGSDAARSFADQTTGVGVRGLSPQRRRWRSGSRRSSAGYTETGIVGKIRLNGSRRFLRILVAIFFRRWCCYNAHVCFSPLVLQRSTNGLRSNCNCNWSMVGSCSATMVEAPSSVRKKYLFSTVSQNIRTVRILLYNTNCSYN